MILESFKKQFPGIKGEEPLKKHCTLRVGGPADFFYELTNIEELPSLVSLSEENRIPYKIIGRGSNVLFTDNGFRGLIIKNLTNRVEVIGDEITADSGVLWAEIIKVATDNNLTGLEPLHGIPGTIGAAVYGNAGVPEVETGMLVKSITVFNVGDGVREIKKDNISFKYRWSSLQEHREIVMRVILSLKKGGTQKSQKLISKTNDVRRGKQPIGLSAGSFFKNPSPDKPAGYLIEQVGLKGFKIGDAQISEKHANFFINTGNATCAQILELADTAKQKVRDRFGIELEMEVKIIGEL